METSCLKHHRPSLMKLDAFQDENLQSQDITFGESSKDHIFAVNEDGKNHVEKLHQEIKSLMSFKKEQEGKCLNRLNLHLLKKNQGGGTLNEAHSTTTNECKDAGYRHEKKDEQKLSSNITRKEKEFYLSKDRYEQAKNSKSLIQEEMHRIMCFHKDLKNQAESLNNLNEAAVLPVLEKAKMDLHIVREEVMTLRTRKLEKAINTVNSLSRLYKEMHLNHQTEVQMLQEEKQRLETISRADLLPAAGQETTTQSDIDDLRKKVRNLEYELVAGNEKLASLENEITMKNKAREKLEEDKRNILVKCDSERRKNVGLSEQFESIVRTLAVAQAKFQSVTTARVQIEIKQREFDDKIRHESASSATHRKQLNSLMSTFVKKKAILDRSKKTVSELEVKLKDQECLGKEQQNVCTKQSKNIDDLKDLISIEVTRLLERTNLEVEIKSDLEALLAEVSEKEAEVETWILETKKIKKIESVIVNQLMFQVQLLRNVKDDIKLLHESVKVKRMVLADVEKTIVSTNKRSNEFRALYESLDGEKNVILTAISASVLSKNELQKQIAECELELQVLRRAYEEKQNVLTKERDCHVSDRNFRATSRVEITNIKAVLSRMKEETEYQHKNIRNLKSILEALSRDAINESMRNGLLYERNSILYEQLNDKKSEIHFLLLRVNTQEESLKRGNLSLIQKQEDIHSLEIQCLAAERYIHMKKTIESEIKQMQEKIIDLRAQRTDELNQIVILSKCIENPSKCEQSGRWRDLGGEDLDDEQLDAKKLFLLQRLDENRELYLERDAILEDFVSKKGLLQREQESIIEIGKPALRELEDCQARVREATRSLMALVSELSMYHATELQLEEEKEMKQEQLSRSYEYISSDQPPSLNAAKALRLARKRRNEDARTGVEADSVGKYMQENTDGKGYYTANYISRTTAEPRPTTYIPDVGVKIPKPFGNMAPFKASCPQKACRKCAPVTQANDTTTNIESTIEFPLDL